MHLRISALTACPSVNQLRRGSEFFSGSADRRLKWHDISFSHEDEGSCPSEFRGLLRVRGAEDPNKAFPTSKARLG